MRISDWSSDVCSSDLMFATDLSMDVVELAREADARGLQSLWLPEHTHIPASRRTPPPGGQDVLPEEYRRSFDPLVALAAAASATDRKSVVQGKSVSVRVDLCGGRDFKKKKLIT